MIKNFKTGELSVNVFGTREEMGKAVANDVANAISEVLSQQEECNIIFAAAPSQNELLSNLAASDKIEWNRINAFHMDEYVGLEASAPQGFGNFLRDRLFGKLNFKTVNYLDGNTDPQQECMRYEELLKKNKINIVCGGIGENCHIAFNDPHVADFNDKASVKIVDLDEKCRTQQVNDGCFEMIDEVPRHALSLTIPVLVNVDYFFCTVPAATKAQAVYNTVNEPISEQYPSTILRNHPNAKMYVDSDSGKLV